MSLLLNCVMSAGPIDSSRISKLIAGDHVEWRHFADDYGSHVLSVIIRIIGDREASNDCYQLFFLRLMNVLRRYDSSRPFEPWLNTVVSNEAKRFKDSIARVNARKAELGELLIEQSRANNASPEEVVLHKELCQLVRSVLNRLDQDRSVQAFHLYWFHSHTYESIEVIFGCSNPVARMLVSRGKSRFMKQFRKMYPDYIRDSLDG